MARQALRRAAGLRLGAHAAHHRGRRLRLPQALGRPLPQGRLPDHHRHHHALNGAAPEEVETEITDKIEEAVNTISGIDELRSTSTEGVSQVFITFILDKDVDVAAQDVRDHVNNVIPDLPKASTSPIVAKIDPDASPDPLRRARPPTGRCARSPSSPTSACAARSRTSTASARCSIIGGRKRQINVWLDPLKLRAAGLTAADVQRAIAHAEPDRSRAATSRPGPRARRCACGAASTESPKIWPHRHRARAATTRSASRDVARVEDGEEDAETVGHPRRQAAR